MTIRVQVPVQSIKTSLHTHTVFAVWSHETVLFTPCMGIHIIIILPLKYETSFYAAVVKIVQSQIFEHAL